jgi:hypothetical protein
MWTADGAAVEDHPKSDIIRPVCSLPSVPAADIGPMALKLDRRTLLQTTAAAMAAPAVGALAPVAALAQQPPQEKQWRHGLSLFGDLRYAPGFKNFDGIRPACGIRQLPRRFFQRDIPFAQGSALA